MNEQFKEQITYMAREFATAYTNRHFPNEPAFAFGHEGWEKFVVALAALSHPKSIEADSGVIAAPVDHVNAAVEMVAGAHPDKGTSALAAPVLPAPGARDQASLIADAQDAFDAQYPLPSNCTRFTGGYASTGYSAWMAHDHCKKWEVWKAAWLLLAATPPQAAPVARDGVHSDQVALMLSKVRVAACVIENLPELPGYNGSVLTIDDTEAARISKELYEIAEFFDKPQAAPVAQLSEPPEADMFWNNDDPERCSSSIHEVLEYEWQDGILQVGDIRTIQQAMKLPNVRVLVTSSEDDEDGFDYDFIEPAAKPQQAMFEDSPRPANCGTGHCSCIECPFAAAPTTPKD